MVSSDVEMKSSSEHSGVEIRDHPPLVADEIPNSNPGSDADVLARFGKRQQLQVSLFFNCELLAGPLLRYGQ
jgi:hypothetical protein